MQRRNPELATLRPLRVGLDGTLVRTDLFIEALLQLIKRDPLVVLWIPFWIWRGFAMFKHEIAIRQPLDPATLPYDTALLEQLKAEKMDTRRIVLVSAADRVQVTAIADHLGIFDEVIASDHSDRSGDDTTSGPLVTRFGTGGFDVAEPSSKSSTSWKPYIKALRLHQWMKNGLVFVPLLLAHKMFEGAAVLQACLAFLAFGFTASAVYVINDLVDLKEDRAHPRKRLRPFASGAVPLPHGLLMAPALLAVSAFICLALPLPFAGVLATYFAVTLAYSFFFKRTMLFDVLVLAGLYTLRIIAGSAALAIPRSFWLLAFSVFLFFSLALVKRYVELADMGAGADTKDRGRGYRAADLETLSQFGISSGMMAVLVLALYIDSPTVKDLYGHPEMIWLLCPLMLYLICRVWILARRGEMHEDPIMFAIRDWRSQVIVGIGAVCLLIATL